MTHRHLCWALQTCRNELVATGRAVRKVTVCATVINFGLLRLAVDRDN